MGLVAPVHVCQPGAGGGGFAPAFIDVVCKGVFDANVPTEYDWLEELFYLDRIVIFMACPPDTFDTFTWGSGSEIQGPTQSGGFTWLGASEYSNPVPLVATMWESVIWSHVVPGSNGLVINPADNSALKKFAFTALRFRDVDMTYTTDTDGYDAASNDGTSNSAATATDLPHEYDHSLLLGCLAAGFGTATSTTPSGTWLNPAGSKQQAGSGGSLLSVVPLYQFKDNAGPVPLSVALGASDDWAILPWEVKSY